MQQAKAQVLVSAPADTVFNYLSDFRRLPEWGWDYGILEEASQEPMGVGSTFIFGNRKVEVSEFVANERIAWKEDVQVGRVRVFAEVESADGGALITVGREWASFRGWFRVFMAPVIFVASPLLRPVGSWALSRQLRALKERVESESEVRKLEESG